MNWQMNFCRGEIIKIGIAASLFGLLSRSTVGQNQASAPFVHQGATLSEPQYINTFYGLGANGNLIELERSSVALHSKVLPLPGYLKTKSTAQIDGARAPVRLASNAEFVVKGRSMTDPQTRYSLKLLKVSRDHRQYTVIQGHAVVFSGSTSTDEESVPIRFEDYGATSYRIVPQRPLEPGEYAFALKGASSDIYCFGVDGAK